MRLSARNPDRPASSELGRRLMLSGAGALAALALPAAAQGVRTNDPPPPRTLTWDKRLSDGRVPFEPSWSYALGRDPAKGEVHLARLTRPVDGVGGAVFACDGDGARFDVQLTQPQIALGDLGRDGTIAVTVETVCRLCGGPIDRLPNAPIGSFNYNASARARVVQRDANGALLRIEGPAVAEFGRIFGRKSHFAMLALGYATRSINLDQSRFVAVYEFQTLESDTAIAEMARRCPAWPK